METVKEKVFRFSSILAEHSGGNLRVVVHEADETDEEDKQTTRRTGDRDFAARSYSPGQSP